MKTIIRYHQSYRNPALSRFNAALTDATLTHYASDLLPALELSNEVVFMESIQKAKKVFATLSMPVEDHFRKIYRTRNGEIYCDYKLSHLAYLLVGINGDVNNSKVAQIQMELIINLLEKSK